ncbi:helix-turn-helix domain-containing protein [Mesorhizobium captivum]|uniref:helix-turn-helix domain-containing protein n=1 Tax=Mesorhizobium captivum TaxID=3072319 RepID=UPI003D6B2C6F
MNIHKNARLTPRRREEMALAVMEGGLSQAQAALKFAVTAKVVRRWVERYKAEGRAGMIDRSSRPKRNATERAVADRIVALRRERLTGKHRSCQGQTRTSGQRPSTTIGRHNLRFRDVESARRFSRLDPVPVDQLRASIGLRKWCRRFLFLKDGDWVAPDVAT